MPYIKTAEGEVKPLKRTPEEVLELIKRENVKFIDLHFTDIPGKLNHTTILSSFLDEDSFIEGFPKLDGSSIKGYSEIYESDMVLKPDPSTFSIIPWMPENLKTARIICDVYCGFGMEKFSRDPRGVAQKAEQLLREMGYDVSYWGPEVEFFVFDKVSWNVLDAYRRQSYEIESREAAWSYSGIGYPTRFKEGYFLTPPQDTLMELRCECAEILTEFFGVVCDTHHHEVASAGQSEINFYRDNLTGAGDSVVTLKYVVRNVAFKHGMVATFMPKPIFMDNASGMHVHVSIWKNGENLFYDQNDEYAELSQLARYFGGGLLEHARSLVAIVAPTTNSYRRLVPGYEAPVYVAWSRGNRSACLRVPAYHKGANAANQKRLEFRPPDPSSNPYLCFAAILAAGLDGIKKKIDIGDPVDEDIYKLTPERRRQLGIKALPESLKEAVECLQSDQQYLKPIFSQDLIDKIIELEINECKEVNIRPHPYEFYLYFDR
ncbi:MAG: type I glutamate--ammonia ligase [Candidatus Bathyarchaeota archaeon]